MRPPRPARAPPPLGLIHFARHPRRANARTPEERPRTKEPAGRERPIEQYDHKGKERLNNPPVGLVTPQTDRETSRKAYAHDPHLDPQLTWVGKAEHTSFEVPTVSLHVHERIDPRTIVEAVRRKEERKPDVSRISSIDPEELGHRFRFQEIVFETARDLLDEMKPGWTGSRESLAGQLVGIVERFLASSHFRMHPVLFAQDDLRRRVLLPLNMSKNVRHLWEAIRLENALTPKPVFDTEAPIRSTGDLLPWHTGRPWADTQRSHVNRCVFDSTWEASEAYRLDHD